MTPSPVYALSDEARYFEHVDRDGPLPEHAPWLGRCWTWTGATSGGGYGQWRDPAGRLVLAHRWLVERVIGRLLLDDEVVDHVCHDPAVCGVTTRDPHRACVNPAHLTVTSPERNNLRSSSPSARNARKAECDYGHAFDAENTYVHPQRGTRHCRACQRRRAAEYRSRQGQRAEVVDLTARRAARAGAGSS